MRSLCIITILDLLILLFALTVGGCNSLGGIDLTLPPEPWTASATNHDMSLAEVMAQDKLARDRADQERRRNYVNQHLELTEAERQSILAGNIYIGMTAEAARASWGEPTRQSTSTTPGRTFAIWTYQFGETLFVSISFSNNILIEYTEVTL